ncbi:hypothetical protein TPR58_16325 [Sphingomonas sp. HF-S3]|uniref:Uncharacterized protein n=2 Tax=Sphingomonas rustica TaxID=3103142 RepID=A0ABV0BAZ9_9SPHN
MAAAHVSVSREKILGMATSANLIQARQFWSEYLTEHSRAFNKLGNAMETGPERGWFERLKVTRKKDALLCYLKQARDADEHGCLDITPKSRISLLIRRQSEGPLNITEFSVKGGQINFKYATPDRVTPIIDFKPASLILSDVINGGTTYAVPPTHLGSPISQSVLGFAKLGAEFLDHTIAEARQKFS